MLRETQLDNQISENIRRVDDARSLGHTPSGKLSASMLGLPVQWQVLKTLGVGTRVIDDYTLRKFLRGNHVEQWLIGEMPGLVEAQKFVEYRNAIGYVDAVVDTVNLDHQLGVIPFEIKSVTNAKFKRIEKAGEADIGHQLQAGLYALGLGSAHYALNYVASDDYRLLTYIYPTEEIKPLVDGIIDEYDNYISRREIPVFVAKQKWQANKEYQQYPEWQELTAEECQLAMQVHYPTAWEQYLERQKQ